MFTEFGWVVEEGGKFGFINLDDLKLTVPIIYDNF